MKDVHRLSPDGVHALLRRAARGVWASATGHALVEQQSPRDELLCRRGVFVTLRRRGELAGCIGYVTGEAPIWELVGRAAWAAAEEDPRFDPIVASDLVDVEVEVSVLSSTWAIQPDEIEIGRHGLLLRVDGTQGLLLPQVATEHDLDRDGFLRALCRKAGVADGAWNESGAELLAFEVQRAHAPWPVLADPSMPVSSDESLP